MRRRDLFGLSAGAVGLACAPSLAGARPFTDSGGRGIDIPDEVRRVFPAGPPASVTIYAMAPDKMFGWTRAPSPEARPFLPARYAELPEVGRLTGRGNTVNLENVVRLMPDLVLVPAGHSRRGPPLLCPFLPARTERRTARRSSRRSAGVSRRPSEPAAGRSCAPRNNQILPSSCSR